MTREATKYEFNKLFKMTESELEQQNVEILVKHIIELKQTLPYNSFCVCSGTYRPQEFLGPCNNCNRPVCHSKKCQKYCQEVNCVKGFDSKNCKDCIEKCKFCFRKVCKDCIKTKYPDWSMTGCKIMNFKYVDKSKDNEVYKVTKYHCIYPDGYIENKLTYCEEDSYFSNICKFHYDFIDEDILDALDKLLPKPLIKLCTDYFYVKMACILEENQNKNKNNNNKH